MSAEYTNIEPSQKIPLTRQLEDGSRAPTRYIRSQIINVTTRAVIQNVDLTDNGNGDFSDYSHTPSSLSISKGYFEVITKVYKDAGYTQEDKVRYATIKSTYYVDEKLGGAILGGREVGDYPNFEGLVKKIFSYKLKDKKSFASKIIDIDKKVNDTNKKLSRLDISKKIKSEFKNVVDNIDALAELIVVSVKNIKSEIPDNSLDFESLVNTLDSIKSEFDPLKNEIVKLTDNKTYKVVQQIQESIDEIKIKVNGINNEEVTLFIKDELSLTLNNLIEKNDSSLLVIREEFNNLLNNIELKIDEGSENNK